MPFKKKGNTWAYEPPTFGLGTAFSAGIWNNGPGGGRFLPVMRPQLELEAALVAYKKAGLNYVEFHDTEAEPSDAERIMRAVRNAGLLVSMVTANLFKRGPEFANGNFGNPNPASRKEALRRTCEYIAAGIETFQAQRYVYWNGSNGLDVPAGANYEQLYLRTADGLAEAAGWMVSKYGDQSIPICVEPKFNEPRGWGVPSDVGEALALIAMVPEEVRVFIGVNPETCHSQMGGKRYAMELGLAAAARKLYYVHLNGGSLNPKFDEDRAFGDVEPTVAVETVMTLQDVGYQDVVAFDVQPLATDTADQQTASIERSVRNFRRSERVCARIDRGRLTQMQGAGDQAAISDYWASILLATEG